MKSVLIIASLLGSLSLSMQAQDEGAAFAEECKKRGSGDALNIRGDDANWFFMKRELKQLAAGKFWEKDWTQIAVNKTDPTSHLLTFNKLLKAKGVRLIMVPVPAKAAIYPDKLAAKFAPGSALPLKGYFDELRKQGLEVLPIEAVMNEYRSKTGGEGKDKLYCEQDSHYTPLSTEIIASLVKQAVENEAWYKKQAKESYKRSEKKTLTIIGDQVKDGSFSPAPEPEVLTLSYAGRVSGGKIEAVPADKNSPVLLLGDSHTMVFTDGEKAGMHLQAAGLEDQLQYELGFAIDRVSNKGSGIMQARKNLVLMRVRNEPGFWDKKKLVVWVFSAREFTQSSDRMMKLPIEVK